jgi:dihydroorotase-like cyclic amidohydrolase
MIPLLKSGKIDFIETDHAPHTLDDKLEKQMSGFPGMPFYPSFIKQLCDIYEFSEKQIQELTHTNIESIFNIKIPLLNIKQPDFNLENEYEFDVYTLK